MANYCCPQCKSLSVHRSRRRGLYEHIVVRLMLLRPYRCWSCDHRHYAYLFLRKNQGTHAYASTPATLLRQIPKMIPLLPLLLFVPWALASTGSDLMLMGLTFSLTSFACVGPFVGALLAGSVQAKGAQPVLGMLSFATGLASPFFFLAAFPQYLKKLPRSGGWLVRVKTVMGFVLLAMMFKYASNIDQVLQTGFLTRERFLAAWFVLFSMAGLYLLGMLRMEGVEAGEPLGIGRLLVASAILIFSFSLLPGMFGAPLGELDAYVPAPQASQGGGAAAAGPLWMKNRYREALNQARQENKLVLVTFTGYACTNCHWMKANLFPKPEIAEAMKDIVAVELYTDGTDAASEENQQLQDRKFSTVAIPYYALMDPDEKVVAVFPGSTRDAREFLKFLKTRG